LTRKRSTRCGFLSMDVVLAVGLTMILFVAVAAAYRQFANAQRQYDLRTELRLAAEAELLRLRASGPNSGEDTPIAQSTRRTVSGVVLETSTRPGEGIWSGLTQVTVVARKRVPGGWTQLELTAYVALLETQP
jgi:hypothetical protein